jgi:hypothetical protein
LNSSTKVDDNQDMTSTAPNLSSKVDASQEQETNIEEQPTKNHSDVQQENTAATKSPGFNGFLAIVSLLCIFVLWRRN